MYGPFWKGVSGGRRSDADEVADPIAAAAYVAELTAGLATIARKHGLETLGYILDMARLEAENANRHVNGRHRPYCGVRFTPIRSSRAAFGWPSVTSPYFFCSARTKSRILKSMCAENRVWS